MSTDRNNFRAEAAEDEDLINFVELAGVVFHKLWLLILCFVVGVAAALLITTQFITPKYEATSMIYIYNKTTSITSLADLQIGSQLAVDFQIVAKTREVMEKVIEDLSLNTTYEELLGQISISNPTGSHILKIQTTSTDPAQAASISNALMDELRERIAAVMNTDEPSVVERAVMPTKPSSPNVGRYGLLGGAACAFLAAAVIVVSYLMDDTIKTEQDVKRYLGLNTLAAIPLERGLKGGETADTRKKRGA